LADFNAIIKDLQAGIFAPVYFLQGEEPFFIDTIVEYIEQHALEESQKSFNQLVLYGKDAGLVDIIGAARRYPMMGERQVVIVKEAQEIKEWTKEDKQTLVINYLENPLPSTILVFAHKHKSIDKRTKLGKNLEKHTIFLSTKKIYDNQVPSWIEAFCQSQGLSIDKDAVMLLSENIGNNLNRLGNEIKKLSMNITDGVITKKMIEQFIGISKDYNVFELQKAIGARNKGKAMKIVHYFSANPGSNPLVLIIFGLFGYFSKLLIIHHQGASDKNTVARLIGVNPFFAGEYMAASRNYPLSQVIQNIQ
jgi:DNA polymerase-3 subunit delta